MGGRSRVAAQMLAGKGFDDIFNLSGGFKAWKSDRAIGQEDLGLEMFSGKESPEEALVIAYSMEDGLREYYLTMVPKVENQDARALFEKLAVIEIKHQERILSEYGSITGTTVDRENFIATKVVPAVEGGLTTEEYVSLYNPDLESVAEIISLAMAIEAQALDLYRRAADISDNEESKKVLLQIADEERVHLTQLGKLFENL